MSLEDAWNKVERWRRNYNEFRPRSAILYLTPIEFVRNTGSEAVGTSIFLVPLELLFFRGHLKTLIY